jgi:3-hydroxybutyrate dehydrogenase
MFEVAQQHFGSIDIVCPGAGVYEPPFSNFWHPPGSDSSSRDSPDGGRYALLDINLTHPIRVTQLAISHFLAADPPSSAQNPKTVVHISSIAGQATPLPAPVYNATKHAMNGFVRSLAPLEARLGIRIAAVAPGVVKTPLWTDNAEKMKAVGSNDAWVTPEEVAEVMVALVDKDEIGNVAGNLDKGENIPIRGGSILEVSTGKVRVVQAFNDPGPGHRPGNITSNMGQLEDDVWNALGTKGWGGL